MSKIIRDTWPGDAYGNKEQEVFLFQCPGCGSGHWFKTSGDGPCWEFNADMDKPTVRASILVRSSRYGKPTVCHSFITSGKIEFLTDCTHDLAGQTVEIPDWDN